VIDIDDNPQFTAQAKVWRWQSTAKPGTSAWFFAVIDGQVSAEIRYAMLGLTRGFGSVPVNARIGTTCWKTSLFPSKEQGGYLLPLKASVRKAEEIEEGDVVSVALMI
jgi:hypothetical protein